MGKESKFISYEKANINIGWHFIKFLIWIAKLRTISLRAQGSNSLSPCSSFKCTTARETPTFAGIFQKEASTCVFLWNSAIALQIISRWSSSTWSSLKISHKVSSLHTLLTEKIPPATKNRVYCHWVQPAGLWVPCSISQLLSTILEIKKLNRWKILLTSNDSGSFWRNRTSLHLLSSLPICLRKIALLFSISLLLFFGYILCWSIRMR